MTGPRAAVRITLTAGHLDDGWLSHAALREVQCLLYDVPAQSLVYLDLGPLRRVDDSLIRSLALVPAAQQVRFESAHWRVAYDSALSLITELAPDEAGTRA